MHCLKCENEFEYNLELKRCPICNAPIANYGVDSQTWEESKNNNPGKNIVHRRKFGFSGFLIVSLSIALFIAVYMVISMLMYGGASKGSPVITPTTSPTPARQLEWHDVISFSGNSTKTTEMFTIEANEWCIDWNTTPDTEYPMNFAILLYNASGDLVGMHANVVGKASDVSYVHESGTFYMEITSAMQSYNINIKQYN